MLTRLRASQRDGRRRQADDVGSFMTWGLGNSMVVTVGSRRIFGGWTKLTVLFLSVGGPKFMIFRDDVGDPS